jgi:hypothetical protein
MLFSTLIVSFEVNLIRVLHNKRDRVAAGADDRTSRDFLEACLLAEVDNQVDCVMRSCKGSALCSLSDVLPEFQGSKGGRIIYVCCLSR